VKRSDIYRLESPVRAEHVKHKTDVRKFFGFTSLRIPNKT